MRAREAISAELLATGATQGAGGQWHFAGQPLVIIALIRSEGERRQLGDYVADQLESIGFAVDRRYVTSSEARAVWSQGDPGEGLFHYYTLSWTLGDPDYEGDVFSLFYTPRDMPHLLWESHTPDPALDAAALALRDGSFGTLAERESLFAQALDLSLEDSAEVWLVDALGFVPRRAGLATAAGPVDGVARSQLYPLTLRLAGQEGGVVRIGAASVLAEPWNPLAGSRWSQDAMPQGATMDYGAVRDPHTGLAWPMRIERAAVLAAQGTPLTRTLPWVDLGFAGRVEVPADAWIDWDPAAQRFVTAGEAGLGALTAEVRVTVAYPRDLFQTVRWHDGSPLSLGDFVLRMILAFDPAQPESPNYDESLVEEADWVREHLRGLRIVSTDPLTIETYGDAVFLDAELCVADNTGWPNYATGPGAWHTLALGLRADAEGALAFSSAKADASGVEWMDTVGKPGPAILKEYLDRLQPEGYLPYAATLGEYVQADEVATRYANLQDWYERYGHFHVGTGPFYLESVLPAGGELVLARNPDYPDLAGRWDRITQPMLPQAQVDGPDRVTAGREAEFAVWVTYQGKAVARHEVEAVRYLVFDMRGRRIASGEASAAGDGAYRVVLAADVTLGLAAGTYLLEAAVLPMAVTAPVLSHEAFEVVQP